MKAGGTGFLGRVRLAAVAGALVLLAGCAVYPDEVPDGYAGGGYYGGGLYYYPGHYYSYYPGYYAYCPPVRVPRGYWSYWRQHRHWPDGWQHGRGDRDHDHAGGWRGDRDGPRRGADNDRPAAGDPSYRGKPSNPQATEGGYRMPSLANRPDQVRGQFSRASDAARAPSIGRGGVTPGGEWRGDRRGGDGGHGARAPRGGEQRATGARASSGTRSEGGSYRGSGGSAPDGGWGGGGYRGGGRGR
jgi:hypothetical protein